MKRRILIGALTALALVSGASREAVAQSAASKAAPSAAIPKVSLSNVERQGYFCADLDATPEKLIFNLAVALKDTWAKIEQKRK